MGRVTIRPIQPSWLRSSQEHLTDSYLGGGGVNEAKFKFPRGSSVMEFLGR